MAEAAAELTIDELARETGMTVRNIRAHQSRGLLPPPEVRARTGYYGPEHVARLRLIQELQGNGYNLAAIKDLVHALERLARRRRSSSPARSSPRSRTSGPRSSRPPSSRSASPAATRSSSGAPRSSGSSCRWGRGATRCRARRSLRAGETLIGLGIPLEKSLDVIEDVARQADSVADAFVKLFLDRIWKPFDRAGQPEPDWPAVLAALEQLRPLATEVLVAIFQPRMTQATEKAFGRELDRRAKG